MGKSETDQKDKWKDQELRAVGLYGPPYLSSLINENYSFPSTDLAKNPTSFAARVENSVLGRGHPVALPALNGKPSRKWQKQLGLCYRKTEVLVEGTFS